MDVRLENETSTNKLLLAKTTAYCLILHNSHIVYKLLTGTVKMVVD